MRSRPPLGSSRARPSLASVLVALLVAAVAVALVTAPGLSAGSEATQRATRARVPKIPPRLAGVPVDPIEGYQGQVRCRKGPRKGTRAVLALIVSTYGSAEGAGLNRACVKNSTSEHYDGRAIDWMVNSKTPVEARKGDSFTRWLTRTRGGELGVMARRLGVMYVIWRGRIWKQYQASAGWQTYERCDRPRFRKPKWDSSCHRNHVHVSLTWSGARMKTSWWTGAVTR